MNEGRDEEDESERRDPLFVAHRVSPSCEKKDGAREDFLSQEACGSGENSLAIEIWHARRSGRENWERRGEREED